MSEQLVMNTPTHGGLGLSGMKAAVDHADNKISGWSSTALNYLVDFAQSHTGEFLAEDIVPWAEENGCPTPPDRRAWGAVICKAGRIGIITKTGFAAKNKLSGNGSTWRPLWKAA